MVKQDDPQDEDLWNEAQLIAFQMLEYDRYRGISEGATHYHATYVNPSWARTLQQVGRLGCAHLLSLEIKNRLYVKYDYTK